jgi:DNA-binding transcriptional LysR family regulator
MQRAPAAILRHMPYFLAVVEEGSVQAAAARMNVAQSALSRRIRLLEHELGGVSLFERTHRGMRLLPPGETLLSEARTVLAAIERARSRVEAMARGAKERVSAGFVEVVARQPRMLEALQAFARDHPAIELSLRPMISEEQRIELARGVLDLGFLYHLPQEDIAAALGGPSVELRAAPVLRDRFIVAVPTSNPLARRDRVVLADLAEEPVVWSSHRKNPLLYDQMLAACERQGYTPRIIMETPTSDVTLKVVAAGMAIGFVPASLIGHAPTQVTFVHPEDFDLEMQLSLVWNLKAAGGCAQDLAAYFLERVGRDDAPEAANFSAPPFP